jgi:hypothetical protein
MERPRKVESRAYMCFQGVYAHACRYNVADSSIHGKAALVDVFSKTNVKGEAQVLHPQSHMCLHAAGM